MEKGQGTDNTFKVVGRILTLSVYT